MWRTNSRSNDEMIQNLKRTGVITDLRVERAMLAVNRANYCRHNPYIDAPQTIGFGATISAPHMHAIALEALKDHLFEGAKALDVGSGSGYLTACMAMMVGRNGRVVGIDHIRQLVNMSVANISRDKPGLVESQVVKMVTGDGRRGYDCDAPYDAIHVGAAASEVPQQLIRQLNVGGRLVVPVGRETIYGQTLQQIDKRRDGSITVNPLMGVSFVPLTDQQTQWPGR